MSEQYSPVLVLTGSAPSAVLANRLVGYDDAQAATAGQACKGVAYTNASAGEDYPVHALGLTAVTSGAAIAAGAALQSDTQGRVVTQTTGVLVGRALEAASAAGKLIQVLLK